APMLRPMFGSSSTVLLGRRYEISKAKPLSKNILRRIAILYLRLIEFQTYYFRRIPRADGVQLVLVQSERFHITSNQTHRLHRVGEERLAGIAGQREMLHANVADGVVHDLWIDTQQRRKLIVRKVKKDSHRRKFFHHVRRDIEKWTERMIDHGTV